MMRMPVKAGATHKSGDWWRLHWHLINMLDAIEINTDDLAGL